MSFDQTLQSIFPEDGEIPDEFQIKEIQQKEYLINGEIRIWNGNSQDVFSPVHIKTSSGLVPKKLGSYPILSEKE